MGAKDSLQYPFLSRTKVNSLIFFSNKVLSLSLTSPRHDMATTAATTSRKGELSRRMPAKSAMYKNALLNGATE